MQADGPGDGEQQPWVNEWAHGQEGAVFRDGVEGVEHLDDDEDGEGQSGGLDLSLCEVNARVLLQVDAFDEVYGVEFVFGPFGTVTPMGQLIESNKSVTISGFCHGVPPYEYADCGKSDVDSNDTVSDQYPVTQKSIILPSWWFLHDIGISWIEAKSCGWWTICDEVDPKELDRRETLWDTQES